MPKQSKKFIFPKQLWLLVLIFTILPIVRYPKHFFSPESIKFQGRLFSRSQYVRGGGARDPIDDHTLYTYAGYSYIMGNDPVEINFEHPPLAKYLIGFSYLVFNNPVVLNLFLYAGFLVMSYFLAWKVLRDQALALGAVAIIGSLDILLNHVSEALLDFPQAFAILLFFVCLFSKNTKKYLLAGITLGLLAGIKYFFPTIGLFFLLMLWWALSEKRFKQFIWGVVLAGLTYLATYSVHFFYHPNPIEFIKFELYRFHWWIGDRTMPRFLIFHTLFTGQFHGWWSAFATEISSHWSLSWPVMFILQLFGGLFLRRANKHTVTLYLYAQLIMIYYAFGAASYDRYLVPLLPVWAILSVWSGRKIIEAVRKKPLASNMLHE